MGSDMVFFYKERASRMFPKLVAMLKKLEFSDDDCCPRCGVGSWQGLGEKAPPHHPDCELDALIKEATY